MALDTAGHMQAAMQAIDESFNGEKPEGAADASWRKVGLVLFAFEFGTAHNGRANYVSNGADRKDMIPFLRETADRFERSLKAAEVETRDQISGADVRGMIGDEIEKEGGEVKLDAIAQRLTDEGKLIEAGWHGYRRTFYKPTTPAGRLHEARTAFMSGAQHLFASVIQILEHNDGSEPTEDDLRRMDQINKELRDFMRDEFGIKE